MEVAYAQSTFEITNTEFSRNIADEGSGGAVYIKKTTNKPFLFKCNGCKFIANEATADCSVLMASRADARQGAVASVPGAKLKVDLKMSTFTGERLREHFVWLPGLRQHATWDSA